MHIEPSPPGSLLDWVDAMASAFSPCSTVPTTRLDNQASCLHVPFAYVPLPVFCDTDSTSSVGLPTDNTTLSQFQSFGRVVGLPTQSTLNSTVSSVSPELQADEFLEELFSNFRSRHTGRRLAILSLSSWAFFGESLCLGSGCRGGSGRERRTGKNVGTA